MQCSIFVAEKYEWRPHHPLFFGEKAVGVTKLSIDHQITRSYPTFAPKTNALLTVKIINRSPYPLPQYETEGSAGMDIKAHLDAPLALAPLERALVPTGLYISLPQGFEAQIRPRSGLAVKRGLTMLNTPGTIDSDYRGEIKCILVNLSNEAQTIVPGERIAQMVVARHERVEWVLVEHLDSTARGSGGFGSTGL